MKQHLIPGHGFLFRENGLSLKELAEQCHAAGVLSDAEFADGGGIPALRRYVYGITYQHLNFGPGGPRKRSRRAIKHARLMREANLYADEIGVNDPQYIRGDITIEDLERFNVPATGKNLINAELIATLLRKRPNTPLTGRRVPGELTKRIFEMARWVNAGRPDE